ncbi:amidohydrolase family protein [Pseudemcibacter aquimaris]|uniref:amidohydrolase family protein n=1 Tax=Pseudemcibacter aquimaris TaxID=2857064 RepID=UPI002010EDE5|nr:amidohydrolase family protein [Pseudemcibacter aquimaris]MCC3862125.1 amidohydrolase family protein [Pseudemcibacter aquimaris]WDU58878.1 amidohydrolase family protein [Pseudemcibacter aquimaris]
MAIDFHAHFIAPKLMEMLEARDSDPRITHPESGSLYHMPISTLPYSSAYYDADERIEYMDHIGMEKQVISLPGLLGIDYLPIDQSLPMIKASNDGIADACNKYPDRLVPLAAVPLADQQAMLDELKRCVEDLGFIGAILPNNAFLSLEYARELAPLFEYANEKKLHFFIHPGWRADEYPVLDTRPKDDPDELLIARGALGVQHSVSLALITLLYTDFLDQYPNMTTHIANLGGTFPMVVERMHHTVEARFPDAKMPSSRKDNLYVDTSSLGSRAVELAAEIYGADKLIVGTDTPIFSGETGLNVIKESRLSDDDKELILRSNALKLLSK